MSSLKVNNYCALSAFREQTEARSFLFLAEGSASMETCVRKE